MGGGGYSYSDRQTRSIDLGYHTKRVEDIFSDRLDPEMDPRKVILREARDSDEHPESLAIIIALDVTGSMLSVPQEMVRHGLPKVVSGIMEAGIKHPQILFIGVGDMVDVAPLQVGQFESSDALIDKWLTKVWLEKGGGGNDGEDYELAWLLAAQRTSIDCFEKRGQKGFLFTIGDEGPHEFVSMSSLDRKIGGENKDWRSFELLAEAQKTYNVYHIHLTETGAGTRQNAEERWRTMLGENLIIAKRHEDIPELIYKTVVNSVERPSLKEAVKAEAKAEEIGSVETPPIKML